MTLHLNLIFNVVLNNLTFRALHLKEEVKCHLCDFTAVWRPLLKAHKIKVHCNPDSNLTQPKKRGRPRKQQNNASSESPSVTGS